MRLDLRNLTRCLHVISSHHFPSSNPFCRRRLRNLPSLLGGFPAQALSSSMTPNGSRKNFDSSWEFRAPKSVPQVGQIPLSMALPSSHAVGGQIPSFATEKLKVVGGNLFAKCRRDP